MTFLRSTLFYIAFYAFCLVYLTALLLFIPFPRLFFMKLVWGYFYCVYILEKYILGLDYRVEGRENLPADLKCIIAAKHFSFYETFKLHLILGDPAVVLKKELLSVPLWGWACRKTDQIAIDRSNAREAFKLMIARSRDMRDQGRPIVIYPQGTRIGIQETPAEKPYKIGIAKIYAYADLPIIPMAHNSGLFTPKGRYLKKSGIVTFRFLPPIPPGLKEQEMMQQLEQALEPATSHLLCNPDAQ